jgi:GNAT superfamily N-acetyltransferase
MTGARIEELPIPDSVDGDQGRDFRDAIEARNASEIAGYGTPEVAYPADELLLRWKDAHEPKRWWGARVAGRIVGRGMLEWQLDDDSRVAWIKVEVHPAHERGDRIAGALMAAVEAAARDGGFTRMLTYVVSPDGPGERLVPPTGAGSVPAGNPEVRFLLDRGWRLEQVTRASRFPLPADLGALQSLHAEAAAIAAGYHVHTWRDAVPDHWREDMAVLYTRMSTDEPTAGLEQPEDPWDAARVAGHDALYAGGPSVRFTAVAEHLPTGRLAGYTQLSAPHDLARPVTQDDTLVLREHRGHRLGLLLKAANLLCPGSTMPGHPSVLTWNAEENRPMLEVNEAVGFVPIGYEGAWRKDL